MRRRNPLDDLTTREREVLDLKRVGVILLALAGVACSDGSKVAPTAGPSRSATPATQTCDTGAILAGQLRLVPHGERPATVVESVSAALSKAIDHAAKTYGSTPAEPVCVHIFPGDVAFLDGLQSFGGLDPGAAKTYRSFLGTVGRDVDTGRDAIYLNAAIPSRLPFLATHEFFHIVQQHVGGTAGGTQALFPTWFLEGVADWEAAKLQEPPFPNWLSLLVSEQRAGRAPSLSSLVTWEQWGEIVAGGNPAVPTAGINKARAAAMFLEEIAGPGAAAEILRANAGGELARFEAVFREISGLDLTEFEARLVAFIEESGGNAQ